MSEHPLSVIEKRISFLERKVYGEDGSVAGTKGGTCIETLTNVHNRLQSAVTGREKISTIFSKLDDLEKFLDPEFSEGIVLPDTAKMNLILLEEDTIRKVVDSLQTVKDLQQYMDSEHIRAAPSLYPKLCGLSQIQIQQEEKASSLTQETKDLASLYNNIITTLTKQFILWDSILTNVEGDSELAATAKHNL